MKDIKEKLSTVINTGKIDYGFKKAVKNIYTGEPRLIIISNNTPPQMRDRIVYLSRLNDTPLIKVKQNSVDLASICGRQHSVSVLTVLDEGESQILEGIS